MPSYAALLRGINVGGKNIIKMADLRASFAAMEFEGVRTYIQSGNVVFSSSAKSAKTLVDPIASMLAETFDYHATLAVLSKAQMRRAVEGAPEGFGTEPERYRYDVMFLLAPLTPTKVFPQIPVKEGVDTKVAGKGVVYFSRLIAKASSSRLSRITGMPFYQQMTVRNWKTTNKVLEMMG